jgi:YVTN family beta-propeller protein
MISALLLSLTGPMQPQEVRNLPPPTTGTLVVLNKAEATASIISLSTGRVVKTLPTGRGPHEVAVSPDGRTAVACDYGENTPGNTLTVIDLPALKVTHTIDLGEYRRPHGIEWMDAERVAVTCEANQAVIVVHIGQSKVEKAIQTGQNVSHMLALSPDAKRAYVANIGSGSMTVLDLIVGRKVSDVATGAGAEGIHLTPDGREIWVTNRGADTVSVIDAASLKITHTLESPRFPIRVKITPDGQRALVSNARSNTVAIFDTKTKERVALVEMKLAAAETEGRLFGGQFGESSVPIGILVHPTGKWAYVANANADAITVLDVEEAKIVGYLAAGREPDGLAWSPLETP